MDKYTLYYTREMMRFSDMIGNIKGMSSESKLNLIDNMINQPNKGKEKISNKN